MKRILIVDDDIYFMKALKRMLISIDQYHVSSVSDSKEFMLSISSNTYDLLFIDLNMPKPDGRECLLMSKKMLPNLPVIIISGEKDTETVIECMKLGAYDFISKPIDTNRLYSTIRNVFKMASLQQELVSITTHLLGGKVSDLESFSKIVTANNKMMMNFRYVEAISKGENPIIISGETGTGKELFAEAIHKSSKREGEFVAVDVSGLDDNVFSDSLFGHIKGAFTGADRARSGLIEKAAGGTLFLDEIGDLQEPSQIKLLRLLQTGMYYPLGSDIPKRSAARIVAAINKPVEDLLDSSFRDDLYYRLSTHKIEIPPLRERKEDIMLLAEHFYRDAYSKYETSYELDGDVIDMLIEYEFPGNVRELRAIIEDAVIQQNMGMKLYDIIKSKLRSAAKKTEVTIKDVFGRFPTISEVTDHIILEALTEAEGSQKNAAKLLGISRQAFNRRLNQIKHK